MRKIGRCFFVALLACAASVASFGAGAVPAIYNLGTLGGAGRAGPAINAGAQVTGTAIPPVASQLMPSTIAAQLDVAA
jgi:hypothetical protein